ncbi:hypothetical protein CR513_41847, partial [Mucuna pruriens]
VTLRALMVPSFEKAGSLISVISGIRGRRVSHLVVSEQVDSFGPFHFNDDEFEQYIPTTSGLLDVIEKYVHGDPELQNQLNLDEDEGEVTQDHTMENMNLDWVMRAKYHLQFIFLYKDRFGTFSSLYSSILD